jgi:hypothetical protein
MSQVTLNAVIVAVTVILAGYLAFSKRLSGSSGWKATVTPLASIMGSGFLVSAPLLASAVGNLALACMSGLLVLAYAVGGAVRFNIRYFEPLENKRKGGAQDIAFLSRVVLAGAYFISVTYYLQLLAAFLLGAVGAQNEVVARLITTTLLVGICGIGMWRGLDELGQVERYAVSLNLGMIGALLLALAIYNLTLLLGGDWRLSDLPSTIDFHGARVLLGLLIVVQGFETSRYLGTEFPAEQRIRTMRAAQLLSAGIYVLFVGLVTVLFRQGFGADVTAIIRMTTPVAAVLPLLLSVAAIGSQFSAAVADSSGAGGLIEDITHRGMSVRHTYLLIMLITVVLTWQTDVNLIIAYASRAFALFYALQCAVAFTVALQSKDLARREPRLFGFAFLALVCLLVFALGLPAG